MKKNHKTVAVITKDAAFVSYCNFVLSSDYLLVWMKNPNDFCFDFNPVAAVTDFHFADFKTILDFFSKKRIRCFCIADKNGFPDPVLKRFPRLKFIQSENPIALKFCVDSENALFSYRDSSSDILTEYYRRLRCASDSDENVLLLGNTGAGKTHDAKIIHENSLRRSLPFVSFTMAESSLESIEGDLFGVEKNSFTGVSARDGILKQAQGGTVFFDEITEIPLEMQAKLLTVISERKFRAKGSDREEVFTGRFIFATNADIDRLVKEKKFREDLYSRINVLRLKVPDLNERPNDITHLAVKYAGEKGKSLTKSAIKSLQNHKWTGNIRQLRNIVVRACTFAKNGTVDSSDLSFD